jgi:hypothetical protein
VQRRPRNKRYLHVLHDEDIGTVGHMNPTSNILRQKGAYEGGLGAPKIGEFSRAFLELGTGREGDVACSKRCNVVGHKAA